MVVLAITYDINNNYVSVHQTVVSNQFPAQHR